MQDAARRTHLRVKRCPVRAKWQVVRAQGRCIGGKVRGLDRARPILATNLGYDGLYPRILHQAPRDGDGLCSERRKRRSWMEFD